MLDEKGNVPNVGRALLTDAVATTVGAGLGVSTVTTYVESSTGVIAGGRTGWTAITVGILFLAAMFFSPVFIAIPSCATAPALIYVGYLMLGTVKDIEFDNITEGVPAFVTIACMALTYSIGDGLTLGILTYVFRKYIL
uniref:Xanthine/uracil permease n=1 Tax=Clostridioides difficile TaxID=1496 RepID=A0A381ID44_CLODI|nr:xanthine/uracil permease [Clostridioides difficile]